MKLSKKEKYNNNKFLDIEDNNDKDFQDVFFNSIDFDNSKGISYLTKDCNIKNRVYPNPKQIYWINKRKTRREVLDSVMVHQKKYYMHESRHRHAVNRLRGPSGRFLSKEEIKKINETKNSEN